MEDKISHLRELENNSYLLEKALRQEILSNIIGMYDCDSDLNNESRNNIERLTIEDLNDMVDKLLNNDYLNQTRNEMIVDLLEERGI